MRVALQSTIRYSWRNGIAALRKHSLLLLGTLVPFLFFFGPTILSGKFLIAGDIYYQSYPLRSIAWSEIARGHAPLWTPYIFSGYPLLAMAQVAIGYPLTWLYLVLPGHWAEEIVVLSPFVLCPIFTYAYVRELGRSQFASLLAALAFTYGGNISSKLGGLSPAANSEIWLPLLLLAIEHSRRKQFIPCLLAATAAFAMSVLAGHGQGFLLVGTLGLFYSAFVTIIGPRDVNFSRWRPLLVVAGGLILGAGVAAFQILETLVAVRNSVRSHLSYEVFTAGAFAPREALYSFFAPPYHYIEVSTYIAPIAVLLAVAAILRIRGATSERAHIVFWFAVAVVAFVLLLGDNTLLYRPLYHLPIFNLFRYPSRHAFEWSFAVSVLSAYGFDVFSEKRKQQHQPIVAAVLFVSCLVIALLWWRSAFSSPAIYNFGLDSGLIPTAPENHYVLWKLLFTFAVCGLFWTTVGNRKNATRQVLLLLVLIVGVCFEAHLFLSHAWFPFAKTSSQLVTAPPVSRWLTEQQPREKRIYTRMNLFVQGYYAPPLVDLPNMTAVRELQNVAGYEQLILDRYSRALGNVGPDGVNLRNGIVGPPDKSLLGPNSHVLDLLNTHYIVGFQDFGTAMENSIEKEGIRFRRTELGITLLPGQTMTLDGRAATGDTLALVTSMAASVDVAQGATVANVDLVTTDGQRITTAVLAGRDSAEWAHERADVRSVIKHQLAPIFDEQPAADKTFKALRYWTRLKFSSPQRIDRIEIKNVTAQAQFAIWKATLYDSETQESATLGQATRLGGTDHLVPVFREGDLSVWQNKRALPRAWLVNHAEVVDSDEALRRIRGESKVAFDPTHTALFETGTADISKLDNNAGSNGNCRLTAYEPGYLSVETESPGASALVVSEIFYPGWEARIDGQPTQILQTNYLFRGVVVPAGTHRVEMHYAAPAAKRGAKISAVTLIVIVGLLIYSRRRHLNQNRSEATAFHVTDS